MYKNQITLRDPDGQRKYLNKKEILEFLNVSEEQSTETRLFSQLLYYTGARIAEIHNLMPKSIDVSNETVVIESLKKRRLGIYREQGLPDFLLSDLVDFIKQKQIHSDERIWSFSLRTASRRIKSVMQKSNIEGIRSCAKGLRHGFAVHAVSEAPLTMVSKWLGHEELETTKIYLNIIGEEERKILRRIWLYPRSKGGDS